MSKKVFNVFSILCFALVLCFMGCTELINPKTETDINLNIDLSKIIKSTRNTGETQSSVSIGENPTIKVAIYDAKKYNATTNSTDNLDLITEAQAKIVNNEAKVKLNNIPVGIDAIVFAELSFSNGNSTEVMYAGNSEVFKVKASDNKVSLVLKKVCNSETYPDDTNTSYEISSWEDLVNIIYNLSDDATTTEFIIANNLTATSTIKVSKLVKITSDKNVTISRGNSSDGVNFEDSFFRVESAGSLELAGTEEKTITLDGGNQISTNYGGAVYVSGGTFTMNNSSIINCSANVKNGGAVYVSGGTFTMNNSSIINCSANENGGAVYVSGGTFNMYGGSINGCFANNSGGGVCMNSGSSFTMSGDSKIDNCYSSSGDGGGVYVTGEDNKSTFKMLEYATITACSADNGVGGGIYLYGKLTMNGGAYVDSSNDVYLAIGTTVTVAGELTAEDVATITPNEYNTTWQVITVPESADGATSSVTLSEQVGKFAVTPQTATDGATINWTINANGFLSKEAVYYVGNNENNNPQGTETSPFTTLQAAVNMVNSINDGTSSYTIYVMNDITGTDSDFTDDNKALINVVPGENNSLNLKICGYNSTGVTIDANQKGRVMYISPNANVTLQNLILTGGYLENNNGAGLYILNNDANVIIENSEISGNVIDNGCGAGIFVANNSGNLKLTIKNSKIFSNTINHNNYVGEYSGAGIDIENVEANITIKDSEITGNKINQDGIKNTTPGDKGVGLWLGNSAETTISGSTISNNIIEKAASNNVNAGGGVYVSGGTFTMSGGAYVDSNNDVYLAGETTVTVGELTHVGIVATITPENYEEGTQVLTADDANLLAQSVGKFALTQSATDGTKYVIGSNGKIAKVSNVIYLTQEVLKSKIDTTNSRYTLTAGEYCVTQDIVLACPIVIDGDVKIYSDENVTIRLGYDYQSNYDSSWFGMIVVPSANDLTLSGNLTIDGTSNSSTTLDYLVMSSGTFNLSNNVSIKNGDVKFGAVYIGGGTFNMTGGTIENNTTTSSCSGIYTAGGTTNISGGTISNNFVNNENKGASIYCDSTNATVYLPNNSTVTSTTGMFTQNIVNGVIEEGATGGGGNESLIQGAYYVSANGDDSNNGSYDAPFKTLNKAISSANNTNSKTVYVIGELVGDEAFYSGFNISDAVGTNDSPINIIGYPDGIDDVLTVGVNAGLRVVYVDSYSYITFKDLTITGGNVNQSGSAMNLTNCTVTLDNVTIKDNSSSNGYTFCSNTYYSDGIEVGSNCTLNIIKSSIENNIRVSGASDSPAKVTIGTECYVRNIYLVSDSSTCTFDSNMKINGNVYICSTSANPPVPAIYLSSSLSNYSSDNSIKITYEDCSIVVNEQLIFPKDGANFDLADEVKKFTLSDADYTISDDGKVIKNSGGV